MFLPCPVTADKNVSNISCLNISVIEVKYLTPSLLHASLGLCDSEFEDIFAVLLVHIL